MHSMKPPGFKSPLLENEGKPGWLVLGLFAKNSIFLIWEKVVCSPRIQAEKTLLRVINQGRPGRGQKTAHNSGHNPTTVDTTPQLWTQPHCLCPCIQQETWILKTFPH